LLEVALAMAVMAICALGLMSTQLAIARHAQAAAARERGAFAADAMTEAARFSTAAAIDAWRARVAAIVPEGLAAISDQGGETSIATVTWAAVDPVAGAELAAPAACPGAPGNPRRDCVAFGFVR